MLIMLIKRIIRKIYFFGKLFIPQSEFRACSPYTPKAVVKAIRKAKEFGTASDRDYYEFGIYRGYTLAKAYKTANKLGIKDSHFWGFDSFMGLPELEDIDKGWKFRESQYVCSQDQCRNYLKAAKVDLSRITLIPGYFKDVLTNDLKDRYGFRSASVILIDCDLYHSTQVVLDFVKDLIQNKTIILFDDWNCFDADDNKGQRRAFREFLIKNPDIKTEHFITFGWHGNSFIVHK